jgi:nucleoside-diphosphate-sugar epimerase
MRALVLGSTGFVGKNIVKTLDARGHTVLEVPREWELTEIVDACHAIRNADGCDVIFFCADVALRHWQIDHSHAFWWQLTMQANVVEAWKTHAPNAKLVCFTSHTAWPASHHVLTEDNMEDGALMATWEGYGQCKRTLISQLRTSGNDWLALALCTQFGPNDNSDRFFPTVVKKLTADPLKLTLEGNPDDLRTFAFVEDTAHNIVLASETVSNRVLVVAGGNTMSTSQVVDQLCQARGLNPTVEYKGQHWNAGSRLFNSDTYERMFPAFRKTEIPAAVKRSLVP